MASGSLSGLSKMIMHSMPRHIGWEIISHDSDKPPPSMHRREPVF
jgi:hypothetical protein